MGKGCLARVAIARTLLDTLTWQICTKAMDKVLEPLPRSRRHACSTAYSSSRSSLTRWDGRIASGSLNSFSSQPTLNNFPLGANTLNSSFTFFKEVGTKKAESKSSQSKRLLSTNLFRNRTDWTRSSGQAARTCCHASRRSSQNPGTVDSAFEGLTSIQGIRWHRLSPRLFGSVIHSVSRGQTFQKNAQAGHIFNLWYAAMA